MLLALRIQTRHSRVMSDILLAVRKGCRSLKFLCRRLEWQIVFDVHSRHTNHALRLFLPAFFELSSLF